MTNLKDPETLLMVHGWATNCYNSNFGCENVEESVAWAQRKKLLNLLRKRYQLLYFNLPGFCCVKEPANKKAFDLEDFSDYLNTCLINRKVVPKAIVGYSFGAVVVLDFKIRYKSNIPIVLISPALKRKETIKSAMAKIGKYIVPSECFSSLKSLYQFIFSKYYREGTPFLRASYDNIARRDARSLLRLVNIDEILLIYGDSDGSTPMHYVSKITSERNLNLCIIQGGDHNIGNTHPEMVAKAIIDFLN